MLGRHARAAAGAVFTPPAALLLRLGVGPDAVTITGTLGVVASSLLLFPRGHLLAGAVVVTVFVLSDTIDGIMARRLGRSGAAGRWGAYLDSTLDRFGDAAVFAGLVAWYARGGDSEATAALALVCLVLGSLVSYAKARAEGLGFTADVGIAERSDRLTAVLVGTAAVGFGAPTLVLTVVLALLALASLVTVVQRMAAVRGQAVRADAGPVDAGPVDAGQVPAVDPRA